MADDTHCESGSIHFEFDLLLARYIDDLNSGVHVDRERIRREHPGVASQLLHQLEVFEGIDVDLEPARELGTFGDFTLRRQIGRGGLGIVYVAWENSMDRQVALKMLPVGLASDTRAIVRFAREAQICGQLKHPNVVCVYCMGVKEQIPYYAMLTGQSPRTFPRS